MKKSERGLLQVDFAIGHKQWVGMIYIDYPNVPLPQKGDVVVINNPDKTSPDDKVPGAIALEVLHREFAFYEEEIRDFGTVTCFCRPLPEDKETAAR